MNTIPVATNLAAAEVMVCALDRGDLDWREIVNPMFKDGKRK
jgi:methylglyoxal synthase